MIRLTIDIEDIDYESVVDMLQPEIEAQLTGPDAPAWAKMLRLGSANSADAVRKIMARMPDSALDSAAVKTINKNSTKAATTLEDMAASKGIVVRVGNVSASKI